jgi:hypothetical protein
MYNNVEGIPVLDVPDNSDDSFRHPQPDNENIEPNAFSAHWDVY